ncbi:hypothetical protein Krac_8517 [Ktedonobacter racemifer DSM 44963]|uniref:Uncharacterized protein n=1 Tax=Ktedonobacter racemifer DSM 44963 TaxID=485913 RepID=D6TN40_KTERA|nr:hypothetical protein Krac_8517 [Ktedonobacter racemifer DSM 44963]
MFQNYFQLYGNFASATTEVEIAQRKEGEVAGLAQPIPPPHPLFSEQLIIVRA